MIWPGLFVLQFSIHLVSCLSFTFYWIRGVLKEKPQIYNLNFELLEFGFNTHTNFIYMNYRLIFQLSLYGLAMALATISWVPSSLEPILWLLIFIICAYFIALKSSEKYFLTGFLVSIANCIWITTAHMLFFQTYMASHPQQVEMMAKFPAPDHPRLMMLIMGPIIGVI